MDKAISIFWFRRDLRLNDNAGLYHALRSGNPVLPVFIFDTNILDDLEDRKDKRVCFIYDSLKKIQQTLLNIGSTLQILYGNPEKSFEILLEEYNIAAVYTNEDYEPYAIQRDASIEKLLKEKGISFHTYKDQVVFAKHEILKEDKTPYTVFTPYSKKWKQKLNDFFLKEYPTEKYFGNFLKQEAKPFPSLRELGFEKADYEVTQPELDETFVRGYEKTRNFPTVEGTTKLSVHLRFGTVSIRVIAKHLHAINETALNEVIWREFFSSILFHFPHTIHSSFKPTYDHIKWRNNEQEFQAWCEGRTGYPIVDAGMRQLNEAGWMHNRVRMVVASFLCKHLLIDWRWGEAYFASKLMDYDMSQNVGNWQWVAGSGVDAAPYFRIFNPITQQQKFDPELKYVKQWVKEFGTPEYAVPLVEHTIARERCLAVYKNAVAK
ncbi:MAG TPA: deoxyribodipyrimidine photo-lyase [Flavipsychrobacter sp.]|nr:deoxyribodipyrimidine photo-lyase [Flavipsychrobacter sp.]